MLKLNELIFNIDLFELKKEYQELIAKDYNIGSSNNEEVVGSEIWRLMNQSEPLKDEITNKIKEYVFAGQTAITWFIFPNAKKHFQTNNLPKTIYSPQNNEITKEPVFIGISEMEKDIYLARYIIKTGDTQQFNDFNGFNVTYTPKYSFISVLISLKDDFIEVRSEPSIANKIINNIKEKFISNSEVVITQVQNFSDELVDRMIKELDGSLFVSESHPDYLIEDFDQEKAEMTVQVLKSLNDYFTNSDSKSLVEQLETIKNSFGELSAVPFIALILAGMDKISIGTKEGKDLRNQALYSIIRPYVKYLKGIIAFPVFENGTKKMYTIRIGFRKKSIYFYSDATEKAVETVRQKVLKLAV